MRQATEPISMAYLVSQYPAVNHTFILREIRQLRALGFDIHVISIAAADRPPGRLEADERDEAARTFYVKPGGFRGALAAHAATLVSRPAGYLRGLAHALKAGRLDPFKTVSQLAYFAEAVVVGRRMGRIGVSHVHSHFSSTVALHAARVFPVTMSLTIHGPAEFDDAAGFRLAEKIGRASFVCAISNFARSQLMKVSGYEDWEKIEVAPLGIDPAVFAPRPFRESPAPFEIICVGRLAAVKAQHVLVAAVDRLARAGRDVRLRLVGDGPDRAALERDVAARSLGGRVVFEGWLNQERVRGLYGRADIFALASFAEGVPVVLMEAMAMEIPCVATTVNGIPELIRSGIDGLLVAPSDEEELARAVAALLDDAALRAAAHGRAASRHEQPQLPTPPAAADDARREAASAQL
ncbi:MAG: glycosyltransferase [Acidobacteria bacterium]|nr:glycosyltransferase [Acidobacteriota bacterium]